MDIKKEYERWLANADGDVLAELKTLDDAKIEDAFYRDLAFGTGGLRGVIGAGTNRMNIYTVAKASQGLADYLKKNYEKPSVVIGYDSRIKSDVFAKTAAGVLAANGKKYTAKATLTREKFPTRNYDGINFSGGVYDALIVELGTGSGDNWWCVAFPPLCFVPEETSENFRYRSLIVELIRKFKEEQ